MEPDVDLSQRDAFFTLSPEMMAVLDEGGYFLDVNPAWEKSLGFTPAELKQTPFFELLHGKEKSTAQLEIQKLLAGGKTATFESQFRRKDQTYRWFRWNWHRPDKDPVFYLTGWDITDLKETQTALEETAGKFRRLAESATEGVAIHEKGMILEANEALARIFGFERVEDVIGKNGLDFTAPEYRELILNRIAAGYADPYEVVGLRKDGSRFNCLISGKSMAYQGRMVRVSTFRDITPARKKEQELYESQELFRKLADASREGIAVSDQGKILIANPSLAKMFGYEISEMIGRNALEFAAPEFREMLLKKVMGEIEESYEVIGLRRDGAKFPLQISARLTSYQGRRVRVAFFRDLTERKKIEAEVTRQKEFNQNLINSSMDGLMAFDKECRYTLWNPAMERLTGHSREEVLGQCAFDVFPFLKQIGQDRYFHDALQGRISVTKDRPYRTPAGKNGFFESVYSPIWSLSGEIVGGLGVIHDITDRKKMEEALRQSELNLKAVFNNTFQNVVLMDREGTIQAFNQNAAIAFKESSGKDLRQGVSLLDYSQPGNVELQKKKLKQVLQGKVVQIEKAYRMADGQEHWFDIQYHPVFGEQGEIEGVCLTSINIDDRKRAAESLRKSESDLRAIFNSGSQMIVLVDRDGRVRDYNPNAEQYLGKMAGKKFELGKSFTDYADPRVKDAIQERFKRVLKGEVINVERPVQSADGVEHWFEMDFNPVFDSQGAVTGVCMSSRLIDQRKKTEEALLRSEASLHAVFNSGSQVTVLIGLDGRIQAFNRSAEFLADKVMGRKLKAGMLFAETLPPGASLEAFQKSFADALEGRETKGERPIFAADGRQRWVEVNYQPVLNDQGGTEGVCFTVVFIDDRKKAEEDLRESEKRYKRLVEESSIAECVIQGEGHIVFANPEAAKLFKVERPEDLIGRSAFDFILPENVEIVKERIKKSIEESVKGEPRVTQLILDDGQLIDVEITGIPLVFQGQKSTLTIFRDITEQKKAQDALQESEERYRQLVEFSPEAVLVQSGGKVVYANSAGVKILGAASLGQLVGKPVLDLVHPDYHDLVITRLKKINEERTPTEPLEQKLVGLDGRVIDVEVKGIPIAFHGKAAALTLIRDITVHKKIQEQLLQYERLATVGKVMTGIAHDIRNPLAVLTAMTESLQEKFSDSPEVKTISEQTERLKLFMNDILDYSREFSITREKLELRKLMEKSLSLVQIQLGPAHERVQVRWEWKQEAIECRGDSQRLVQVFWNLLLNAYQAMPEGGILTLWGEMGEGWASVKIQDNGPGILEAELPRLFEPFYTTKRGGSGLGLPISRKILEAHGGKIDVKSLSPYGTLFTLQIPTRT